MNDSRYPWCILVPRRAGVREIHELREDDQVALLREIVHLSEHMQASFRAHKMNVAALGNQVPQLHVHVIARQTSDPAWPGPVWGVGEAIPYTSDTLEVTREKLVGHLGGDFQEPSDSNG
jgi:diadenosine tetraphosphate (Ap4A) HIT family hydrolase